MLIGLSPCLQAAVLDDWKTVFRLLEGDEVTLEARYRRLSERNPLHPCGFRIFDYAENYVATKNSKYDSKSLIEKLLNLGAVPSFDIKLFAAAKAEDWPCVFTLLSARCIDVNFRDQGHPHRWSLVDYATAQGNHEVINQLLRGGGKDHETLNEWEHRWQQEWQYAQQWQYYVQQWQYEQLKLQYEQAQQERQAQQNKHEEQWQRDLQQLQRKQPSQPSPNPSFSPYYQTTATRETNGQVKNNVEPPHITIQKRGLSIIS